MWWQLLSLLAFLQQGAVIYQYIIYIMYLLSKCVFYLFNIKKLKQ